MTIKSHYCQSCPCCDQQLKIKRHWSGQNVRCSHCSTNFRTCFSDASDVAEVRVSTDSISSSDHEVDPEKVCWAKPANHSVLLVDNEQAALDSLAAGLSRSGAIVTAVHHPRMAISAVRVHPYAVAVLENNLPETTGIELMKSLRSFQPDLQVVILSGSCDFGFQCDAILAGAFAVMEKPCQLAELNAVMMKALRRSEKLPLIEKRTSIVESSGRRRQHAAK